jgi:hypothetical protein
MRLFRRRAPLRDDPRAQSLVGSTYLLYQELEPSDAIVTVCIMAVSGRQFVSYALTLGDGEVHRTVVDLDDDEAIARGEAIDATVPDELP